MALAVAALLLSGAALFGLLFPGIPYGPVPDPPAFDQPPGEPPPIGVGLQAWAHYRAQPPRLVGSGFVLELPDGRVVGVTAAHSFRLSGELGAIGFRQPGSPEEALLATLHGEPGRARLFGNDLTGDYLLLSLPTGAAARLAIAPDPRGGPAAGERIVVHSGVLELPQGGAVFRSEPSGAWAVMDEQFEAALTSGAPVFSSHTGLVVGMALVAGSRDGQLVLGMHPIGSIVQKGLAAEHAIPLAELPKVGR